MSQVRKHYPLAFVLMIASTTAIPLVSLLTLQSLSKFAFKPGFAFKLLSIGIQAMEWWRFQRIVIETVFRMKKTRSSFSCLGPWCMDKTTCEIRSSYGKAWLIS